MINVLITDPISDNGIKILEDKGINIFYNPDSKKSSSSSKRGRRSSSNTNDKNDPIFKEISNPFLKSFFTTLHTFMGKISKVQFKYDVSQSHTHNNVLADHDIDYMFRLGLADTPNSLLYAQDEGQLGSFSHSYNYNYRFTIPSISVIPSISLTSMEFKVDSTRSVQSTAVPSSNKVMSYYPFGLYGDKGVPLPSWGITWSGLEKIDFIKNRFKSFKFSHNSKGQRSITYQNGELIKNDYSLLFSPLIKLSARSKGKNPIDFEIGSKFSLDIYSEGSTIEHTSVKEIYGKIEYSRSKGMYLPLPFFRDLDLQNTVSFSFNTNYDLSTQLVAYQPIQDRSELVIDDYSSKLSLSPKMSYQFSKYVSGNVFYKYILTNDINTGRRDEKDFGFNVVIAIRG